MRRISVYEACIRAVGDWSSYPAKFSASITVIMASSLRSPSVILSISLIWNARVAGNADPLFPRESLVNNAFNRAREITNEHSMSIRSGRNLSTQSTSVARKADSARWTHLWSQEEPFAFGRQEHSTCSRIPWTCSWLDSSTILTYNHSRSR